MRSLRYYLLLFFPYKLYSSLTFVSNALETDFCVWCEVGIQFFIWKAPKLSQSAPALDALLLLLLRCFSRAQLCATP